MLKNALRDDVAAGRRRLHIGCCARQSVREATQTSGVDNTDWQTPLN